MQGLSDLRLHADNGWQQTVKMIGRFEAKGLVPVSGGSQWLGAVTGDFRGRTQKDPSCVIFCSRVADWEPPLVLPEHGPGLFLIPVLVAGGEDWVSALLSQELD